VPKRILEAISTVLYIFSRVSIIIITYAILLENNNNSLIFELSEYLTIGVRVYQSLSEAMRPELGDETLQLLIEIRLNERV